MWRATEAVQEEETFSVCWICFIELLKDIYQHGQRTNRDRKEPTPCEYQSWQCQPTLGSRACQYASSKQRKPWWTLWQQHELTTGCQVEISFLPWALTSLTVIPAMAMFAGRKEGGNPFQATTTWKIIRLENNWVNLCGAMDFLPSSLLVDHSLDALVTCNTLHISIQLDLCSIQVVVVAMNDDNF